MNFLRSALAGLLCVCLALARNTDLSCGTHPDKWREELHLHNRSMQRGTKRLRSAAFVEGQHRVDGRTVQADAGHIAVLDDADGVVSRRNAFNLARKTIKFLPVAPGTVKYRYETAGDEFDQAAADSGTLLAGIGDDDTRAVPIPFPFPFYGAQYRSLFINSDGNVTFGAGDGGSGGRSLGRMTAGAPRVAALFTDLDPSVSRRGIKVLAESTRFVITWDQVPEYSESGLGAQQTFQMRLYIDGRVEFAYSTVNVPDAVAGISPGRMQGTPALVSFINPSQQEYTSTVAERFSASEEIDIFTAAQKFYLNHEDAYDYLVLYNTLGIAADDGVVAYEVTVRNDRAGYGDRPVDLGLEAGSRKRLQAVLNMGPLSQFPRDPNAAVPARPTTGDTSLTVLGHEAGHLFLAYASIRDENDPESRPMLGRQGFHWSFSFNSEASLLEGNRIRDNGPGASPRFTTTVAVEGYSPLDQYLMGFRPASEVADTFVVRNSTAGSSARPPQPGVGFNGERQNIRIDEIIAAEGRRTPDYTVSQRRFRFAFGLVVPSGTRPTAEQLQHLDELRTQFETFYQKAATGNASAETTLKRALNLSLFPAAGVVEGNAAMGSVSIEQPAATQVTVLLRAQNGGVTMAPSVVIPAGAREASFELRGARRGVDTVTAEPSDAQFMQAVARIQVAAARDVRMAIVSGNEQPATSGQPLADPVAIRLADENNVPYPGMRVQATVSAGGTVTPVSAVSGADGVVQFRWTPGSGAVNELRASLDSGTTIVATAAGWPAFTSGAVVNAASFAPGISPGSYASIFGTGLAGATVQVNGREALAVYTSPSQVNFLAPEELPAGEAEIVVRTAVGSSVPARVAVLAVAPGVFFNPASGLGAIRRNGNALEIYATGLGPVMASGQFSLTRETPQVLIGERAAEVLYSGLAPGYAGLYQVNVRIPEGLSGLQPVSMVVAGVRSNEVKVELR